MDDFDKLIEAALGILFLGDRRVEADVLAFLEAQMKAQ